VTRSAATSGTKAAHKRTTRTVRDAAAEVGRAPAELHLAQQGLDERRLARADPAADDDKAAALNVEVDVGPAGGGKGGRSSREAWSARRSGAIRDKVSEREDAQGEGDRFLLCVGRLRLDAALDSLLCGFLGGLVLLAASATHCFQT
jgi:hypothetical protein